MSDELADAQAWYDRAQQHIAEYRSLAYGENDRTWQLRHDKGDDGRHIYSLHFNRGLFPQLKPIACEAANAMFQSLDNIIATAARQAGVPRSPQIAWPWALQPDTDSNLAGAVKPAIDSRLRDMRKRGIPSPCIHYRPSAADAERTSRPPARIPHSTPRYRPWPPDRTIAGSWVVTPQLILDHVLGGADETIVIGVDVERRHLVARREFRSCASGVALGSLAHRSAALPSDFSPLATIVSA